MVGRRGLTSILVAGAIAGGAVVAAITGGGGGGPAPSGTANAWVSPNAGASPTVCATPCAYDSTKAYGSFDAAWDAVGNGATIRVTAGTYPGQTISGNKTSTTSIIGENGVVLTHALIASGNFMWAENMTINTTDRGQSSAGQIFANNVTFKNIKFWGPYVAMGVDGTGFTWQGGEIGQSGTTGGVRVVGQDGEPIYLNANNATIDGLQFNPQQSDRTTDFHLEMIRVQEVDNITIKNNYFVGGTDAGSGMIFVTKTSPGRAADNLKLINNIFEPVIGSYSIQVQVNVTECHGWQIAYNTWYQPILAGPGGGCTSFFDPLFVGNLGVPVGICQGTHIQNVWQDSSTISCGTDITVNGSDNQVNNLGLNSTSRLNSGSPAIDAGETTYCSSLVGSRDLDGGTRPIGSACDAGADEFGN